MNEVRSVTSTMPGAGVSCLASMRCVWLLTARAPEVPRGPQGGNGPALQQPARAISPERACEQAGTTGHLSDTPRSPGQNVLGFRDSTPLDMSPTLRPLFRVEDRMSTPNAVPSH